MIMTNVKSPMFQIFDKRQHRRDLLWVLKHIVLQWQGILPISLMVLFALQNHVVLKSGDRALGQHQGHPTNTHHDICPGTLLKKEWKAKTQRNLKSLMKKLRVLQISDKSSPHNLKKDKCHQSHLKELDTSRESTSNITCNMDCKHQLKEMFKNRNILPKESPQGKKQPDRDQALWKIQEAPLTWPKVNKDFKLNHLMAKLRPWVGVPTKQMNNC